MLTINISMVDVLKTNLEEYNAGIISYGRSGDAYFYLPKYGNEFIVL